MQNAIQVSHKYVSQLQHQAGALHIPWRHREFHLWTLSFSAPAKNQQGFTAQHCHARFCFRSECSPGGSSI